MAILTLTWHASMDEKTCPICRALNNHRFTFDTTKGPHLTDALFHPVYGIVWSMAQGSNAHDMTFGGHYGSGNTNNCRCTVTPNINAEDFLAKCVYLAELLKDALEETNLEADTKKGSYRTTRPEDIGIDLSKYGIE